MNRGLPILCLAVCLLLPGAVGAQTVYTWKDASGTTHYSQRPPTVKARELSLRPSAPAQPVAASTVARPASTASTLGKASEEFRRQACATAKGNLKLLSGSAMVLQAGTVSHPAGVLGARKLSEAQRQAAKVQAQANIHSYCDRG